MVMFKLLPPGFGLGWNRLENRLEKFTQADTIEASGILNFVILQTKLTWYSGNSQLFNVAPKEVGGPGIRSQ